MPLFANERRSSKPGDREPRVSSESPRRTRNNYHISYRLGRAVEYNNIDSVQLCHFEGPAARRGEGAMKSTVVKRSVVLAGHKTSVSLEDPFWEGLKEIAKAKRQSLSELVGGGIDTDR